MTAPVTVGVDLGGTKTAAAVVSLDGRAGEPVVLPTPSPEQIPATVNDLVRRAACGVPVERVGIGAAGFIDTDRSTVRFSPNIDWSDVDLGVRTAELLGVPVVVENDANAAAWAEYRFGAAMGATTPMMVTVGTGIGGGVVSQGQLVRGAHGMAAEFGHLRVVEDGRECGCGRRGCLEQYASGRALDRMAAERLGPGASSPDITARWAEADPLAEALLAELGGWLARGLAQIVTMLDPDVMVLGGGVATAARAGLLEPVTQALGAHLPAAGHRPVPRLVAARCGNAAGLIGAADLARQD